MFDNDNNGEVLGKACTMLRETQHCERCHVSLVHHETWACMPYACVYGVCACVRAFITLVFGN